MSGPMAMGFHLSQQHRKFMSKMREEVASGRPMATEDAKSILGQNKDSVLNTARQMRAAPETFIKQMSESGAIAEDHPLARAVAARGADYEEPRAMHEIMQQAGEKISGRNGSMTDRVRWLAFDRAIHNGAKINGEAAIAFLERSMNRAEKNGDRDEATAVAGLALEAHDSWGMTRFAERRAHREARADSAR